MIGRVLMFLIVFVILVALVERAGHHELGPDVAQAHLVRVPAKPSRSVLENRAARQRENLRHAAYVCARGGGQHKRWACWAVSSVIRGNGQGWLRREWRETMNLLRPATQPLGPVAAIHLVFGAEGAKAVRVAMCESNLNVHAVGNSRGADPYYGLFQQGSYSRARYGFGWSALEQARAAKRHRDAEGWGPWPTCGRL